MLAPLPVVINRSAGAAADLGERLEERVRQAFAGTGREILLSLVEPAEMPAAIARHGSAPVVVVGGGDGTLGSAAAQLSGKATALAVLPMGTDNHLACKLCVPLKLEEAAEVAATGARRRMGLGRAGGRVFISCASIPLDKVVGERERSGLVRWLPTVAAAWRVLRTMRSKSLRLRVDGAQRIIQTPRLMIANGRYSLDFSHLNERDSSDEGLLSVSALAPPGALRLIWLALKVLLGLDIAKHDFAEIQAARELVIEGEGEIGVALDGELVALPRPLRIAIEPAALGIVVPRVAADHYRALSRIH